LKVSYDKRLEKMEKVFSEKVDDVEGQMKKKVDKEVFTLVTQGINDSIDDLKLSNEKFIEKMDERLEQGSKTMHRLEVLITEIKGQGGPKDGG
jgi:hypothetical protein